MKLSLDPSTRQGTLEDGTEILVVKGSALKSTSKKNKLVEYVEFWTGLELDHPNVMKLFGLALDGFSPLLVWDSVPLSSLLSDAISGETMQINWKKRYKIIKGIAEGMAYLHHGSKNRIIIHGNINPNNILLDRKGRPIIAWFKQAHHLDKDEIIDMPVARPETREYIAYIAPEHWDHGHLSRKADIFSFGVLLLELISGISQTDAKIEDASYLLDRAYKLYKKNKIKEFIDPTLEDPTIIEQVTKCIMIALLCVHDKSRKRPDMDSVVSMLAGDIGIMEYNVSSQHPRQLHDVYQVVHDEEYLRRKIASQNCFKFSYDTLVDATQNFQIELGRGGFGVVYRGKYREQDIAVKMPLNVSPDQRKFFLNEVRLLSSLKHHNVVQLVGYCIHGNQHLLVFEYIGNGSLEELLSGNSTDRTRSKQKLDWTKRYGIIKGIAAALNYLHVNLPNSIVHRDIKLANILLDDRFRPKIADFGISRSLDVDQTHVTSSLIISRGYAAPEYFQSGRLSTSADVYSFGVVVLEIISGERYHFMPSPPHVKAEGLLDWAYKLFERGKTLDMMDPTLTNPKIHAQVKNCVQVALLCVQGDYGKRPSMQEVFSMLTLNKVTQKILCRPGFYGVNDSEDDNILKAIKRWVIRRLPLSP